MKRMIQLPETVDQDEMDNEEGITGISSSSKEIVCYFIIGGNPLGAFSLDKVKHILRIEKELDREEQAVHIVVIKATDQCDSVPETTDLFDPDDDTLLKVVVNVNDINDNRPVFVKSKNSNHFFILLFYIIVTFF